MPATVVLGAQWGDEGKGKLVDRIAEQATWVARFQGGNNAGHTVVLGDQVLKFHLLPSGITRKECNLILGDGMVVDPWVLDRELNGWNDSTGEGALVNIKQATLGSLKDDMLAKFEGIVKHEPGVGNAVGVGCVNPCYVFSKFRWNNSVLTSSSLEACVHPSGG